MGYGASGCVGPKAAFRCCTTTSICSGGQGSGVLALLLEPLASLLWAHLLALDMLLAITHPLLQGHLGMSAAIRLHGLAEGLLLVCALQFVVSFWLDQPYDVGLRRIAFWMVWYPAAYWLLSFSATLRACWRLSFSGSPERARWVSPDRGHQG
jgi:biofilm PGA synthesis N-glycosyltransferase PgaC